MALEELQNGRYRRLRLLGSGGMGEVHLMEDTRVNRQVAIKVIRSESSAYVDQEKNGEATRLFQREAKAIAALEHPNILPLYDFGEEILDELTITYMVMPFCADGSMAGWVKQRNSTTNKLTPADIAHLIEQAAEALQYAHDQQVIHLDVKPSNFLLRGNRKSSNRPTLLLADFGIARSFTTVSSSSRTIRGTPTSMAPEQWSGSPVPETDQYALAIMTYEMLAGRPPFVGSMEQLMYRHFAVEPPPPSSFNPRLPPTIDAVLLRALTKKPEDRFPSIVDFANAFSETVNALPQDAIIVAESTGSPSGNPVASDTPKVSSGSQPVESGNFSQMVTLARDERDTTSHTETELSGETQISEPKETPADDLRPTPAMFAPFSNQLVLGDTGAPSQASSQVRASQSIERAQSEHNLPTLSIDPPLIERTTKKRSPLVLVLSIILGVVLVALLAGGSIYYLNGHQPKATPVANIGGITGVKTATAVPPSITPTLAPSPTPPPGLYIADHYNGSMTDQAAGNKYIPITIAIVQTNGSGALQGALTYTQTRKVSTLTGTVDKQGNFSIFVQQPGKTPLFLSGTVQKRSDGNYLNGNYCSSSTNFCPYNTGYFTVGPGY